MRNESAEEEKEEEEALLTSLLMACGTISEPIFLLRCYTPGVTPVASYAL